jgi:hypothetical protein
VGIRGQFFKPFFAPTCKIHKRLAAVVKARVAE